jgi:hypothetical protein
MTPFNKCILVEGPQISAKLVEWRCADLIELLYATNQKPFHRLGLASASSLLGDD